jgi:hypothetical protein
MSANWPLFMNGRVFSSVNHLTATHKLQPALLTSATDKQFGLGTVWEATESHDLVVQGTEGQDAKDTKLHSLLLYFSCNWKQHLCFFWKGVCWISFPSIGVQIHPIVYIQVCLSHVPTILQVELASISEPYELVGAVKSPQLLHITCNCPHQQPVQINLA